MDDDPLGAEAPPEVDVGPEVLLGGLGQQRRGLRDVDGGGGVQAEVDAVTLAGGAQGRHARGRPRGGRVGMVGRALQAGVDVMNAVGGRPREAVLQAPAPSEIHADPLAQRHGSSRDGG